MWNKPPLEPTLSGLEIEFRILQIYSRDHGPREASLEALTRTGSQDLGYRSSVPILFNCLPSHPVPLRVHDAGGLPATASIVITDQLSRIYPAQSKRPLPDLWFQPQIYRSDGENLVLPEGTYNLLYGRGPEYVQKTIKLDVTAAHQEPVTLALERWVTPARLGYYSGDSHIHAAGCSHYESPSEGVTPDVMRRQVEGEALDVGAVLTWAPGFRYQSQFFTGHVHHFGTASATDMAHTMASHSAPEAQPTLRYDLEVSGFPSSHCGHLVLLKLARQNYPGTSAPNDWPSWNLPILQWAKSQGAITGYAHSGHGMVVDSTVLPNSIVPPFNSCGANEYLVDITHPGLLDFISGCDLWPFVELNLWYHVLNCGFPLRFAGETDFPCITDRCVGGGRSYVKLASLPVGDAGYHAWISHGLEHGHSYFGDGRSHLFDFTVHSPSAKADARELNLDQPSDLRITATVCARLEPEITDATEKIRRTSPYMQPLLAPRKIPPRHLPQRTRRARRQRQSRAAHRDPCRWQPPGDQLQPQPHREQLDRPAHPPLLPHQPHHRPHRQPAHPRIKGECHLVPQGCRRLLDAKSPAHPALRDRRRQGRIRSRPHRLRPHPHRNENRALTASAPFTKREPTRPAVGRAHAAARHLLQPRDPLELPARPTQSLPSPTAYVPQNVALTHSSGRAGLEYRSRSGLSS